MGVDYFKVLGVSRAANEEDIKRAYRISALKYHPDANKEATAYEKFSGIAEAFDVLSDPKKRALYEQFGEEGLKSGVPDPGHPGHFSEGYQFHGRAEDVFTKFFGENNPFKEFFTIDASSGGFGGSFGGLYGMGKTAPSTSIGPGESAGRNEFPTTQDAPVERPLPLTLEELFLGTVKKIKITKKILNDDRVTTSVKDKVLTIDVKRGWKAGTRITFPKEGDQGPNRVPADLVFIVKELPHATYKREGNDLHHTATLPLVKALTGTSLNLTTLDNRVLNVSINEVINPQFTKIISGEGMPVSKSGSSAAADAASSVRGNLHIHFNLSFPTYFSESQKGLLRKAFTIPNSSNEQAQGQANQPHHQQKKANVAAN